jgi:hypothetical protein
MKKLLQTFSLGQCFDTTSDVENGNTYVEQRSNSRTDSAINSTTDNNLPDSNRMSPTPMKKRTFSKIFSVFTNRSNSLSTSSNVSNNDLTANTSTGSESNRVFTSMNKEPMKRTTSVVS